MGSVLYKECGELIIIVRAWTSGPLLDLSLERVKNVFDTNTYSALRTTKAVVPAMAKRRSGLIINIGSVVGEMCVSLFEILLFLNLIHLVQVPLPGRGYTVLQKLP